MLIKRSAFLNTGYRRVRHYCYFALKKGTGVQYVMSQLTRASLAQIPG